MVGNPLTPVAEHDLQPENKGDLEKPSAPCTEQGGEGIGREGEKQAV